ncbi:hypothetical protein PHYNN_16 [Pantoea phage Phynn]|nr:hypothetical protein PHYNN_16 [Pantoea phage Phynn]
MSESKCPVCKADFQKGTGFVTESGELCSAVCVDYINEQKKTGRLNEGDDNLNEVQMLL